MKNTSVVQAAFHEPPPPPPPPARARSACLWQIHHRTKLWTIARYRRSKLETHYNITLSPIRTIGMCWCTWYRFSKCRVGNVLKLAAVPYQRLWLQDMAHALNGFLVLGLHERTLCGTPYGERRHHQPSSHNGVLNSRRNHRPSSGPITYNSRPCKIGSLQPHNVIQHMRTLYLSP